MKFKFIHIDGTCGNYRASKLVASGYYVPAAEYEDLQAELNAVMVFVDKWLSGDQLKQSPANRANEAREVALKAIEALEKELQYYLPSV